MNRGFIIALQFTREGSQETLEQVYFRSTEEAVEQWIQDHLENRESGMYDDCDTSFTVQQITYSLVGTTSPNLFTNG